MNIRNISIYLVHKRPIISRHENIIFPALQQVFWFFYFLASLGRIGDRLETMDCDAVPAFYSIGRRYNSIVVGMRVKGEGCLSNTMVMTGGTCRPFLPFFFLLILSCSSFELGSHWRGLWGIVFIITIGDSGVV